MGKKMSNINRRTAEAFGVIDVVIVKGSVNPFNPKAVRASAGGVFSVNLYFLTREELFRWKDSSKVFWIATTATGKADFREIKKEVSVALVFGSEGGGVGEDILRRADLKLGIPIRGKAESLNVAVSSGIVLYEFTRERFRK